MENTILEELSWRGLINQVTDEDKLKEILESPAKIYVGVDPTADSMHVGHLLPLLILKRFLNYGHTPVVLAGGGTGQIGDPSGRSSERSMLSVEEIQSNTQKIINQFKKILDVKDNEGKVIIKNNNDWLSEISVIEFLRDYGKFFSVNTMLAKEVVASRLDSGISFTEFSYQILQSLDWYKMYKEDNVQIQLGGSDQWGNITAGTDLIRKKDPEALVAGITMPLILKSDGTKFGKSAGGSVWLDRDKTSPYQLYQFFLNSADKDVIHYLKVFTFLSKEEIDGLEKDLEENPHLRAAQKKLAQEMVTLIHSDEDYQQALSISQALFSGDIAHLDYDVIQSSFEGVPTSTINGEELNIVDFLVDGGICKSKREAREFISNNSITINGIKTNDLEATIKKSDAFNEKVTIVRRGKKNYFKVDWS